MTRPVGIITADLDNLNPVSNPAHIRPTARLLAELIRSSRVTIEELKQMELDRANVQQ